ncbi:hypothetical protein Tco_0936964 [Tanacetum coccineum]|uniref:Uncharacterized protein n=1 Tax=Tanacetum coccineum TaxID=301880 RepID=A0ABQ5DDM8_9ASTR
MRYRSLTKNEGKPSHEGELDTQPLVLSTYADVIAFLLSDDEAQESENDILGADKPQSSHAPSTKASDTNSSCDDILKKYNNTLPLTECQLEKHKEVTVNYDNLKASIDEYYDENIAHRDQTDKVVEASMSSLDKISTTISDLYKGLNIITELLKEINNAVKDDPSSVNALQAHALKQDKELAAWAKSSTNMAWNLGSRLSGQSLGSVTPTLALTHISANVEGENATNTATEDPPSYTERETDANRQDKSEEPKHSTDVNIEFIGISTDEQVEDQRKLVKASSIIHPDPDAFIPYTIDGEVYYLTTEQLHAHMDKEEKIKKTEEESKLFTISKPEMIKVVQQEAKKLGIHLKEAITTKAGENFKKARDAEHEFLKRQHTKKVRKSLELKKHKYDNYMWTISSRLKPETITDVKILPKTKPVVITVFRGTNGRNFDVHKPFTFGKYERIRKIPDELGIKSSLPAPAAAHEQASSKSSRKKRKHMELEHEIKIHGLNPEHGIFFTDEFGDQAFQRWRDINKVGMEALVSYLVATFIVQSPENARFSIKLKKLIAEHPDQEKLK